MFDERVIRDTRAVVDLDKVGFAVSGVKGLVGDGVEVMAVVKADGYGHGAIKVAKKALKTGAESLGIAYPQEAFELRDAGIDVPILVMGLTPPESKEAIEAIVKLGLSQAVAEKDTPTQISSISPKDRPSPLHIKVDTGMGRIGIPPEDVYDYVSFLRSLKNVKIEGIFTHFPSSDEVDPTFTERQIRIFSDLLSDLKSKGIEIPKRHMANSGAVLAFPKSYLNMVRPGIMIYGLYPSKDVKKTIPLNDAMSLVTRIRYLKRVKAGTPISYGRTHVTTSDTLVATLPIGYADGYSRLLSNRGQVLVGGVRAPVIGRVCMDMIMADVTHIPDARVGDEVILFGRQKEGEISIDEVAETIGTINYEITCMVGKRVPRVYINE